MAGIISSELQEYIHQVLHESLFILPSGAGQIAARWGTIPAHDTYDPYEIAAIDERSWLLDLDISTVQEQEFKVESLMEQAHNFTERLYTFWRWVVTDEFLRRYGVEVDAEADLTESSVRGFVVVTQTCDLVRSCADRPFVEVAPLVAVDEWMVEITAAIGSV